MALQFIIRSLHADAIARALADTAAECEIFPLDAPHRFGLSIPTKVVDTVGEDTLRARLATLCHYDLWAGQWNDVAAPEKPTAPKAKGGLLSRLWGRGS